MNGCGTLGGVCLCNRYLPSFRSALTSLTGRPTLDLHLDDPNGFSGIAPGKIATMAPGGEPLSIESLLKKQKEEREATARVSK